MNLVQLARDNGYDVAVINYRGYAGAKLQTANFVNFCSYEDVKVPMEYIYNKFVKRDGQKKKCFAVGLSMGAGFLASVLGKLGPDTYIDAAVCVQAPCKWLPLLPHIKSSCYGMFEKKTVTALNAILLENKGILQPYFKQKHNLDMCKLIEDNKPTIDGFDKTFHVPLLGLSDVDEYYEKASCYTELPSIKTPTFFLNTLDDPYIGP